MFTGIVEDTGEISLVRTQGETLIGVKPSKLDADSIQIGESIAVNGVCLTVVSIENGAFFVQASDETLSKTTLGEAVRGAVVNLERSVSPDGLMGGHIVTGHIDGVGEIESAAERGESVEFIVSLPPEYMKYIVPKCCVTLNGVSLTVNDADDKGFSVNIIPHTLSHTTFSSLSAGSKVNFECDIVAKYVERLVGFSGEKTS
ncbi:MAG: riboflavin synthase [Candidatus Mycalebacterium zealandia]|nr:MAG: riboflavin synthase [Candidatus Mycalebacterium zealandia]